MRIKTFQEWVLCLGSGSAAQSEFRAGTQDNTTTSWSLPCPILAGLWEGSISSPRSRTREGRDPAGYTWLHVCACVHVLLCALLQVLHIFEVS